MRYLIFCISICLFQSCGVINTNSTPEPPVQTTVEPSNNFLIAKYITEMTYITKDKTKIKLFADAYKDHTLSAYPSLWKLEAWSKEKDRDILIKAMDILVNLKFRGQ